MIVLEAFSFSYPGTGMPALQDISLRLESGGRLVAAGLQSFSGNSKLAWK